MHENSTRSVGTNGCFFANDWYNLFTFVFLFLNFHREKVFLKPRSRPISWRIKGSVTGDCFNFGKKKKNENSILFFIIYKPLIYGTFDSRKNKRICIYKYIYKYIIIFSNFCSKQSMHLI